MELLNLSEKPQKIEGAPLSIVELHTGSKSPKIGFEKGCRLYLQGARKKKRKKRPTLLPSVNLKKTRPVRCDLFVGTFNYISQ